MAGVRKKAPPKIAVIDPDACFGAFACSICQVACPIAGCIVEVPDQDGRMVCAVRADLCIGCGLCVAMGNTTAPQQREFGCPQDYDAINMYPLADVVTALKAAEAGQIELETPIAGVANEWASRLDEAGTLTSK